MVRALIDGRKTMTRRLAWTVPGSRIVAFRDGTVGLGSKRAKVWQKVRPGDRLWVRENFYQADKLSRAGFYGGIPVLAHYQADIPKEEWRHAKFTPSIHMPRWASRITLTVTATKIERLQEISAVDCVYEGVGVGHVIRDPGSGDFVPPSDYWRPFSNLWCSLHGADAWDANPGVVALTFTRHMANIDEEA